MLCTFTLLFIWGCLSRPLVISLLLEFLFLPRQPHAAAGGHPAQADPFAMPPVQEGFHPPFGRAPPNLDFVDVRVDQVLGLKK
jgi:hypothetical protein